MSSHETKLVVRYSETDQMGRVYYSRYKVTSIPENVKKLI
jgi:acyl-CoA thioesterase FadM